MDLCQRLWTAVGAGLVELWWMVVVEELLDLKVYDG